MHQTDVFDRWFSVLQTWKRICSINIKHISCRRWLLQRTNTTL